MYESLKELLAEWDRLDQIQTGFINREPTDLKELVRDLKAWMWDAQVYIHGRLVTLKEIDDIQEKAGDAKRSIVRLVPIIRELEGRGYAKAED